jgi:hypothetical protein
MHCMTCRVHATTETGSYRKLWTAELNNKQINTQTAFQVYLDKTSLPCFWKLKSTAKSMIQMFDLERTWEARCCADIA